MTMKMELVPSEPKSEHDVLEVKEVDIANG
jgi:hypothetical protein